MKSILLAFCLVGPSVCLADTVFLTTKPTAMTLKAASTSKVPVWKCERVKLGPNINPVKVAGSTAIWSASVGKGIENAGELLADNKTVYRCKSMLKDNETGRMKSASIE